MCVVHVLKSHWSFAVQTCSEQHVQDADGSGIGKRDVYEDDFEKPFLRESREFFRVSHSLS